MELQEKDVKGETYNVLPWISAYIKKVKKW